MEEPKYTCAICQESIPSNALYITNCGHPFCKFEITQCEFCPLCREPLTLSVDMISAVESTCNYPNMWQQASILFNRALVSANNTKEREDFGRVNKMVEAAKAEATRVLVMHGLLANQAILLKSVANPLPPIWSLLLKTFYTEPEENAVSFDLRSAVKRLFLDKCQFAQWMICFMYASQNWYRLILEMKFETLIQDKHMTRKVAQQWEWKRLAMERSRSVNLGFIATSADLDLIDRKTSVVMLAESNLADLALVVDQLRGLVALFRAEQSSIPIDVLIVDSTDDEDYDDEAGGNDDEAGRNDNEPQNTDDPVQTIDWLYALHFQHQ